MLAGSISLDPGQQRLLTEWALKTELMLDLYAIEEFMAGRLRAPRARQNRAEIAALLRLICDTGLPDELYGFVVARFAAIEPSERVPSIPALAHPASVSIASSLSLASWGAFAYELTLAKPKVCAWYRGQVFEDHSWVLLDPSVDHVGWSPNRSLSMSSIGALREQLGHTVVVGSHRDVEAVRRAASTRPTAVLAADDQQDAEGLGMALARIGFRVRNL